MDTLSRILESTRQLVIQRQQFLPLQLMEQQALRASPPRGFKAALDARTATGKPALITEIKKASPSAGLIRPTFAPAEHARAYAKAGASCLSVLTEPAFFQGSEKDLEAARSAVALPVLRKDFMVSRYQIIESRAMGADCVLIIMAALTVEEAVQLEALAHHYGMDVLVEVHNRRELEHVLTYMKSPLIGINNRNLATLEVSLGTSEQLRGLIPNHYTVVCESGIRTHHDITRMREAGMHVFLVGESLMRQHDIARATRQLLGELC